MAQHQLNIDAIQCGVDAFLATYPDETALDGLSPLAAPRGAHQVLWIDDWWRGVDMAREVLESAKLQREPIRSGAPTIDGILLRMVACAAAAYMLSNEGRRLDCQVALCSLAGGGALDIDDMDIEADAVDVFVEQIASIYSSGDPDNDGCRETDLEIEADEAEPA